MNTNSSHFGVRCAPPTPSQLMLHGYGSLILLFIALHFRSKSCGANGLSLSRKRPERARHERLELLVSG
jgi:hypothetical protein